MPRIPDTQLDKLIEKANDPTEFNTIPADKVIVSRTSFQALLDNLKEARADAETGRAWMDVATELADDLLAIAPYDRFDQAAEGSAVWKFNLLASAIEAGM